GIFGNFGVTSPRLSPFSAVPCLKILLSKVLGYGIVAGSVLVKVPQLLKVWGSRSGGGLSLPSVLLELLALGGSVGYGCARSFPFSAWGESLFLLLQTLTLLFLILHFGGRTGRGLALVAVFGAFLGLLVSPLTPLSFVTALQALNLPIIILSRLIQIVTNARQGHTGQLSGVSTGLLFGGALARIFTSLTVRPLPKNSQIPNPKKNPPPKKSRLSKPTQNPQNPQILTQIHPKFTQDPPKFTPLMVRPLPKNSQIPKSKNNPPPKKSRLSKPIQKPQNPQILTQIHPKFTLDPPKFTPLTVRPLPKNSQIPKNFKIPKKKPQIPKFWILNPPRTPLNSPNSSSNSLKISNPPQDPPKFPQISPRTPQNSQILSKVPQNSPQTPKIPLNLPRIPQISPNFPPKSPNPLRTS
uniref:Mannose-P-dolichol utilization defect 1 protein-like n=1 Tax=Taeniopygia guttata TaxID=59729 RepID=A0A674G8B0_TAEGU